MDADLGDGVPFPYSPGQDFSINQSASAVHLDVIEYFAFIELECTVNIPQFQTEQKTNQLIPAECVDFSQHPFLSIDAVSADNITMSDQRHQDRQFAEVKLSVAVGV